MRLIIPVASSFDGIAILNRRRTREGAGGRQIDSETVNDFRLFPC